MASTRGQLVSSFLLTDSPHPLTDQIGKIIPKDAKYAGFNLLLLAPAITLSLNDDSTKEILSFDGIIASNGGTDGTISSRTLTPEERHCGGMSNGLDGQEGHDWPKVVQGIKLLSGLLQSITSDTPESTIVENLMKIMS